MYYNLLDRSAPGSVPLWIRWGFYPSFSPFSTRNTNLCPNYCHSKQLELPKRRERLLPLPNKHPTGAPLKSWLGLHQLHLADAANFSNSRSGLTTTSSSLFIQLKHVLIKSNISLQTKKMLIHILKFSITT